MSTLNQLKMTAASLLLLSSSLAFASESRMPAIIPQPASVTATASGLSLPAKPLIASGKDVSSKAAEYFVDAFADYGRKASKGNSKAATVTLTLDKSMAAEAYSLNVTADGIKVSASGNPGFYYAALTLGQLLAQSTDGHIEGIAVKDSPRFPYRGFMIDVTRCYQPVDSLKKLVDQASRLKLNNVHLHLTDDNGWRLEIKKYPRLTEVGAWRVDRPEIFPARANQRRGEEATYGGFYTQREMRDLVKYAAERHVNIIPEIEMPAHSVAAMASYPELACQVDTSFFGVLPGIGGYDARIIACAGNDRTLKFYEDVLTEVMDIFPSEYIHLGGDEANKERWKKCELCNKRIAEEGLGGYEELQAWFMDRINHFVRSKGRTAIGWDEVTYGDPKEDMVIMGWQGLGQTAVNDSRRSGRRFIMTPARKMYLIRYQGPQWFEPFTYFGNVTLKDVYDYEAVEPSWSDSLKSNLMGVQSSMWTEFCRTPRDVEYMVFPRMIAAADAAWRPEGKADWPYFLRALDAYLPSVERAGVNYARSMFNLDHSVESDGNGGVKVSLSSIRPDLEIRYSLTDSLPESSVPYNGPITLSDNSTVYAATYADGVKAGRTLVLPVRFNKATAAPVMTANCMNGLAGRLTNGLRGSDRNSDFEWAGWHNDVAQFTVDLGSRQKIDKVTLGNLANINLCIAAPAQIFLFTSDDGTAFSPAGKITPAESVVYAPESTVTDFTFDGLAKEARYVKVVAVNPGAVPDGMPREGAPTWLYFDEITVE